MRMDICGRPRAPHLLAAIAALCLIAIGPAGAGDGAGYTISLWAPPTPPGTGMAAIYGEIDGAGAADRLLAVATPAAAKAEMHRTEINDGVMQMRPVEAYEIGIDTPLLLERGANHIMLMGLAAPLADGDSFTVTLTFEDAGTIDADVMVREPD